MRQALLLVLISAAVMLMACQKAAPTPEAVEEVPPLELSAELSLEVGDLGELDLSTLLARSEEPSLEGLAMPELDAGTSPEVVFDLEFEVEGTEP